MTPESDNFEQLKKLLALKRHEVPPPGYFNNFSRDVIGRIRAGDTASSVVGASWLQRLQRILAPRPAFASAFGLAVCALLVGGILYSARMDDQSTSPDFANNSFATLPTTTSPSTVFPGNNGTLASGMNSLDGAPPPDSLFNPMQISVQPVNWHPTGN